MAVPTTITITITLPQLAKMIDHSLLDPTLTDDEVLAGLEAAKQLNVAAACVKPYSVPAARDVLANTDVLVCAVVGFPHGGSTTRTKVLEAQQAVGDGAREVDVVVNAGKVLGGDWAYVADEIRAVRDALAPRGAALKVVFEAAFLEDDHVVRLCRLCSELRVACVKTATGYGSLCADEDAALTHLNLIRANVSEGVQVNAAGGIVRTLDELLTAMLVGVSRIGASATEAILEEAVDRGIGTIPVRLLWRGPAEK
ncbi:hypothetical protein F4859DRAFT_118820 [Xylaria cf. heliscus]|nr:hypothetical protein F4859DRAFT_118820 [Xylaria cf. heliscus]